MPNRCVVCEETIGSQARLCTRCKTLRDRPEQRKGWKKDPKAREKRMRKQWDAPTGAFLCHYTGLPLKTEPENDGNYGPLYATWEHRDPRSPSRASQVVLVGWLINDMKTDLTEQQFERMVKALASRLSNKRVPIDPKALPRRWRRGKQKKIPG